MIFSAPEQPLQLLHAFQHNLENRLELPWCVVGSMYKVIIMTRDGLVPGLVFMSRFLGTVMSVDKRLFVFDNGVVLEYSSVASCFLLEEPGVDR